VLCSARWCGSGSRWDVFPKDCCLYKSCQKWPRGIYPMVDHHLALIDIFITSFCLLY
jgi:hypothetical protein